MLQLPTSNHCFELCFKLPTSNRYFELCFKLPISNRCFKLCFSCPSATALWGTFFAISLSVLAFYWCFRFPKENRSSSVRVKLVHRVSLALRHVLLLKKHHSFFVLLIKNAMRSRACRIKVDSVFWEKTRQNKNLEPDGEFNKNWQALGRVHCHWSKTMISRGHFRFELLENERENGGEWLLRPGSNQRPND